jgi:hypothetical protein
VSDSAEHERYYAGQHGRMQAAIRRLQEDNVRLRAFVETVAWGEWAEVEDGLFDAGLHGRALAVRDQARALIEERRAA